jgi:hypothetical protein
MAMGAVVLTAAAGPLSVELVEDGLHLEASLSRPTYRAGETVEVELRIANAGSAPVSVTFTSGQRFDLAIRRPRGDEVWRWSHDKAFIQVIETLTLEPGQSFSFQIPWEQRDYQGRRVDPGPYQAVAVFMGWPHAAREVKPAGHLRLPPLAFTIGAP